MLYRPWFVGRYVTELVGSSVQMSVSVIQTLVCWSVGRRSCWVVSTSQLLSFFGHSYTNLLRRVQSAVVLRTFKHQITETSVEDVR